jgi:hypothetical protein
MVQVEMESLDMEVEDHCGNVKNPPMRKLFVATECLKFLMCTKFNAPQAP